MEKAFNYTFQDKSQNNGISFDYSENYDERINLEIVNNKPVLSANKNGYLFLAKVFLKLALCDYKDGFHFHLHRDVDSDQEEIMIISVDHASI